MLPLAPEVMEILFSFLIWLSIIVFTYLSYRAEIVLNKPTGWEFFLIASMLTLPSAIIKFGFFHLEEDIPLKWRALFSASILVAAIFFTYGAKRLKESLENNEESP